MGKPPVRARVGPPRSARGGLRTARSRRRSFTRPPKCRFDARASPQEPCMPLDQRTLPSPRATERPARARAPTRLESCKRSQACRSKNKRGEQTPARNTSRPDFKARARVAGAARRDPRSAGRRAPGAGPASLQRAARPRPDSAPGRPRSWIDALSRRQRDTCGAIASLPPGRAAPRDVAAVPQRQRQGRSKHARPVAPPRPRSVAPICSVLRVRRHARPKRLRVRATSP